MCVAFNFWLGVCDNETKDSPNEKFMLYIIRHICQNPTSDKKSLYGIAEVCMLHYILTSTSVVFYCRIEHETFTASSLEAYRQLVRVLLVDFLPFVKTLFDGLYSQEKVMQLAHTSSPYALRHQTSCDMAAGNLSSSSALRGLGVEGVRMGVDVQDIGEPLRHVAPEMFQELEAAAERQRVEQNSVAVDVAGVTTTAAGQVEADLSVGNGSVGFCPEDSLPNVELSVSIDDHSLPDVTSENEGDGGGGDTEPSQSRERELDCGVEGGIL